MNTRIPKAIAVIGTAVVLALPWIAAAQTGNTARTMAGPAAGESAADVRQRARRLYIANSSDTTIGPLFQKAAEMGDPLATMWLAVAFSDGTCGLQKDADRAARLVSSVRSSILSRAESGDPEAQFLWATALSTGIGMKADDKAAFEWFLKAARAGDDTSMNNVAIAYLNGVGTAVNDAEAYKWLSAGAETGNCFAMYNLGRAFLKGRGTARDEAKAMAWNLKAAEKGFLPAMVDMALMYQWGAGIEPDLGIARDWYGKAAQKGANVDAALALIEPAGGNHGFKADEIRRVPYVKAFGLTIPDYTRAMAKAGVVSDDTAPKGPLQAGGADMYAFPGDGISVLERCGRVWALELFDGGQRGFGRFKGNLPLELTWDDTVETVRRKLGKPDNEGWAATDETVYAMAYGADNMNFVATFTANKLKPESSPLRTVRVMAKWHPKAKGAVSATAKKGPGGS